MTDDEIAARARDALGPSLFRKLQNAIRRAGGTHTLADVARGINAGTYQIMQTERSLIVTEVISYPQAKCVHVFLAAGDLTDLFEVLSPRLEAFARKVGADRLSGAGRSGWARSAKAIGWSPAGIVMSKQLDISGEAP